MFCKRRPSPHACHNGSSVNSCPLCSVEASWLHMVLIEDFHGKACGLDCVCNLAARTHFKYVKQTPSRAPISQIWYSNKVGGWVERQCSKHILFQKRTRCASAWTCFTIISWYLLIMCNRLAVVFPRHTHPSSTEQRKQIWYVKLKGEIQPKGRNVLFS